MKLVQQIIVVWLILFLLFWIPKMCKASDPDKWFTKSWQQKFAEKVYHAQIEYELRTRVINNDEDRLEALDEMDQKIETELRKYADTTDMAEWSQGFTEQVVAAYVKFHNDLEEDATDSGCVIAEAALKKRIESILSNFQDNIRKEDDRTAYEELHAKDEEILRQDRLLDERAAYQDARQFND